MKRCYGKGTISVFLSLVSVLFLSLLCTAEESARIEGCRAKAAAALDMGMFSVMGEFERELLERYDVFFLDGAAGSGSFNQDQLNQTLQEYMTYNVSPNKGLLLSRFDIFSQNMTSSVITGTVRATDEKGAAFYQQAVGFMRENLGTEFISIWLERMKDGQQLENAEEIYKSRDESISESLKQMEEAQKQLEAQTEVQEGETQPETETLPTIPESQNPLNIIRKLKKEGILGLVLKDKSTVSQKTLSSSVPSKRTNQKGNLPVDKKYSGLTADLLFQQYLFERFSLFTDREKEGVLDYELEYILCGKNSDEKNLKTVVTRLLLLREGANFLFLSNDAASLEAANAFAALLVGAVPIPGIVTVTAYALLLAWAYAESLLDVRELLAGGKVPVLKSAETWRLSLTSVPNLLQILEQTDGSSQNGLSYAAYLQILFTLGGTGKYPMRALDLIEGCMQSRPATAAFRADHAICKIQAEADFHIPPLFLRVSRAFLKTGTAETDYHISGSFAY